MNTHTPGPWRFEESTKTIRSEPENYWLATMNSWDGAVDHAANARLIAAAPDLLDALSDLMKSCQNWAPTIDRSRARAAIDKAKGE